jgi:hypothetical protein
MQARMASVSPLPVFSSLCLSLSVSSLSACLLSLSVFPSNLDHPLSLSLPLQDGLFRLDVSPSIALQPGKPSAKRTDFLARRWRCGHYRDPNRSVLQVHAFVCTANLKEPTTGLYWITGLYLSPVVRFLKFLKFIFLRRG